MSKIAIDYKPKIFNNPKKCGDCEFLYKSFDEEFQNDCELFICKLRVDQKCLECEELYKKAIQKEAAAIKYREQSKSFLSFNKHTKNERGE